MFEDFASPNNTALTQAYLTHIFLCLNMHLLFGFHLIKHIIVLTDMAYHVLSRAYE